MDRVLAGLLLGVVGAAVPAGCISRNLNPPNDASLSPDVPDVPLDLGAVDRVSLDLGAVDRSDFPPPCNVPLGMPCNGPADCCGGLSCVALVTGVKICTRPCSQIIGPSLSGGGECGYPHGYARCACDALPAFDKDRSGFGGSGRCPAKYCMPTCEPKLGQRTCPTGIACAPSSTVLTWPIADRPGEGPFPDGAPAVCAQPACTADKQCPVRLSERCKTSSSKATCASSPPGAYCFTEPGETEGTCALPGVCDLKSGLCAPHGRGKASASVGDPCKDDRDCGGNMRCDQQRADDDGVHARNGYCYIEGCLFPTTLPSQDCPEGSVCSRSYPGGRCYKSCDPVSAMDCRGHPADAHGDYECIPATPEICRGWTPACFNPDMACEPADHVPCTRLLGGTTCADLGGTMACRDRVTGAVLPDKSPDGFCLDVTTSVGCLAGYTECNGDCVDLLGDDSNCGACGNACASGQSCVGGECI